MNPIHLNEFERAVYAAAFGAEFARSLMHAQSQHRAALATTDHDDEAYNQRTEDEKSQALEDAVYVAELAVRPVRAATSHIDSDEEPSRV